MKTKLTVLSFALLLMMAAPGLASEGHMDKGSMGEEAGSMMAEEGQESAEITNVGNKICPLSGEAVGEMGPAVEVEYDGKIYNLCCKMCVKDFMKDPEKYSAIAEAEVMAQQEEQE